MVGGLHPGAPDLVVFPPPVGRQRVAAMGLDEMRALAEALPGLRETGFYVGGFPDIVNYGVIPLVYAGMKVAPKRAAHPLGRLLDVGLRRFSRPPYATFLQLDGGDADQAMGPLMRLRHDDAYLLTAAPVVAAIRQVLADPRPGVHLQGMFVEPKAFFADLAEMGVDVWTDRSAAPGPAPSRRGSAQPRRAAVLRRPGRRALSRDEVPSKGDEDTPSSSFLHI